MIFFQEGPDLTNTFEADTWLKMWLEDRLPKKYFAAIEKDLKNFGEKCAGDISRLGRKAETHPPILRPFNPFGKRIDEIEVSGAWKALHKISASEGLISLGYKREQAEWSRLYQFAKLYLFHPSSAFYTCPLAMTDGAARVLEVTKAKLPENPFAHLTSDKPENFWTSGQWMTEKTGGSDVSSTSTIAKKSKDQYELYGVKWFSSATTSEMALALARIEGAPEGSKGLSLFYVPMRNKEGGLNNIEILRLKDKLGTKAVPTAELELKGAKAYLISEPGQGVKTVATMLNITRLYNAICSIGQSARGLQLIESYSEKRKAFGKEIADHPLHVETFKEIRAEWLLGFALTMYACELLGRDETDKASDDERLLLRLLTPIIKLLTAKRAIAHLSEVVEGFGGVGYIEDSEVPVLLRDAQVFSIWEGTTNVLSLDVLRVLSKPEVFKSFATVIQEKIKGTPNKDYKTLVLARLEVLSKLAQTILTEGREQWARKLAFQMGDLFGFVLLLDLSTRNKSKELTHSLEILSERFH